MKLHLGCGNLKLPGWINVDLSRSVKPDMVVDLEEGLGMFKDNTFDEVRSSHTLEHIRNLIPLMEDIYRICKPGAKIIHRLPYAGNLCAFQDPTHVRFFTEKTFHYFDRSMKTQGYEDYDYEFKCDFKIKRTIMIGPYSAIYKLVPLYVWKLFFCHMIHEMEVELEVVK